MSIMKYINQPFTIEEFEALTKLKDSQNMNWRELILSLLEGNNGTK